MSTLTTRGLFRKAALGDAADAAVLAGQLGDDIDAKTLLWAVGATGAMPASALDGRVYHDTTLDRILYDTGTTWRKLLYQTASGEYVADNIVNATGLKISSVSLAASHLSNGVTGTGAVVLASTPTLLGTPLAPTAAPGTNTTQIATTAFVQAAVPLINSIAGFQARQHAWAHAGAASTVETHNEAVVFPVAFSAVPVVELTSDENGADIHIVAGSKTVNGFTAQFRVTNDGGGNSAGDFDWFARIPS